MIVVLDGARYVASRRAGPGRARLEAPVLRHLAGTGLAPGLVVLRGAALVQEHVAGERLSAPPAGAGAEATLAGAVDSLLALQEAAATTELAQIAPLIGARPGWTDDLFSTPLRLAERPALPIPAPDRAALNAAIAVETPRFIKWDARPGNALARPDGTLCWFDRKHCGRRAAIDDFAWLLADEWPPEDAAAEALAIAGAAPGGDGERAAQAFFTMAALHSFVRLSLIVGHKADGPWWNHDSCLAHDRIGVTAPLTARLCRRAGRWADQLAHLRPLRPLLDRVQNRLELPRAAQGWPIGHEACQWPATPMLTTCRSAKMARTISRAGTAMTRSAAARPTPSRRWPRTIHAGDPTEAFSTERWNALRSSAQGDESAVVTAGWSDAAMGVCAGLHGASLATVDHVTPIVPAGYGCSFGAIAPVPGRPVTEGIAFLATPGGGRRFETANGLDPGAIDWSGGPKAIVTKEADGEGAPAFSGR